MQSGEAVIGSLKKSGFRMTNIRRELIGIFSNSKVPLSAPQLRIMLEEQGITANKTTIYREIYFLLEQKIILEIDLGEGKKRYEMANRDHHHHLVCIKCFSIEDVELEADLHEEEVRIERLKKFKITNHALEFFGFCAGCQ